MSNLPPGVIRSARRPVGWVAPGPAPRGDGGRPDLSPQPGEDLSYLCGDWRVFQKQKGHRWSLDDLVTAWVAVNERPDAGEVLDLGCGLGSVLLLVAFKLPSAQVTGLEAQADRAELARRSIAYNGVDDRCVVHTGDLRSTSWSTRYDLITGTPPYFAPGTGTESNHAHAAPCRFEHRGGVEAYLAAAAVHLREGGRFVMCASSLERSRIADAAGVHAGVLLRPTSKVVPREGKRALVTVDVFEKAPATAARPRQSLLTVRDASLRWTPAFSALREQMGLPPTPPESQGTPT